MPENTMRGLDPPLALLSGLTKCDLQDLVPRTDRRALRASMANYTTGFVIRGFPRRVPKPVTRT